MNNPSLNNSRGPAPLLVGSSPIPLLTENHIPNESPSGTGPPEGDFPATIPLQRHSEAVTSDNGSSLPSNEALADTRINNSLLISPLSTLLNLDQDADHARYVLCVTLV